MEQQKQTAHYEGAVIIRVYPSKNGGRSFALARARGMDLNIPGAQDATRYDIKIVQSTGCAFPNVEGVYRLSFDGEAWVDHREGLKYPTIWIRPMGAWSCLKKRDLPTFGKAPVAKGPETC